VVISEQDWDDAIPPAESVAATFPNVAAPIRTGVECRPMPRRDPVREQLARLLDWQDAHVSFERAVEGVPVALRGRRPKGLPSLWELLEHIRLCQLDILDFCRDPNYAEKKWPDDYWPARAAPPDARAWSRSLAAYRRDLAALQALARGRTKLTARIPHGSGQSTLRELVLVADHTAYHVGQMIAVRRLLGCWPDRG
jgi:uncharacterized damage-inducible protein DinB